MQITTFDSESEAADACARLLGDALRARPAMVLGLATGGTMLPVYARLRAAKERGEISLAEASSFNLDEYIGLGADHPASYHQYMEEHLFRGTKISRVHTHLPKGDAPDPEAEALRYEALIRQSGGIDLQLLGLGRNGHIGFNEPGSPLASRTRVVDLAPSTLEANKAYFAPGEAPPRQAITMGIATILEAKRCVLLATGEAKAEAVAAMAAGEISSDCPASALRDHPDCEVLLDVAAASRLPWKKR